MSRFVIDASVAVKWVVPESGSADALRLLEARALAAPELIVPECANVLWKKVRRNEITEKEARLAARLMERADLEIVPTRTLLAAALDLALSLSCSAYDCLYLTLAIERGWVFVTADDRFLRAVAAGENRDLRAAAASLKSAVESL